MKKLATSILAVLLLVGVASPQSLETLSAYAAQPRSFFIVQVPNPDGAWNFTSISITAAVPSQGDSSCWTRAYVVDWYQGTFSYYVPLGPGGWSSNQTINFTVPKNDNVGIWLQQFGNCTSLPKEINVTAQYTVVP